jgi:hypothetical protein
VIVGELTTRVNASGKPVEISFSLILTIADGEIARVHMLEDSFEVPSPLGLTQSKRRVRGETPSSVGLVFYRLARSVLEWSHCACGVGTGHAPYLVG